MVGGYLCVYPHILSARVLKRVLCRPGVAGGSLGNESRNSHDRLRSFQTGLDGPTQPIRGLSPGWGNWSGDRVGDGRRKEREIMILGGSKALMGIRRLSELEMKE